MTHNFKPVTPTEEIQVAILDELQQIRTLLEPRQEPAPVEPASVEPADPASTTGEPKQDEPAAKKAPAKKSTTRRRVTGQ